MKAIVQHRYGGVDTLELTDVPKPNIKDHEILVEVKSANIASGDMRVNTLDIPKILLPIFKLIFGFKGPRQKVRGISGSGVVVDVGDKVTNVQVGEKIYYINSMKAGCMAEYVVLKDRSVFAPIPDGISFDEAAPLAFGAMTALHFIHKKNIHKNASVLIYGASGSVGTYALQLATYYGGTVTAVCSEKNHKLVLDLGAKHVIDYHKVDVTSLQKQYDVVFDAVGKLPTKNAKRIVKKGGTFVTVKHMSLEKVERLLEINKIIKDGGLTTVIDQVYQFTDYKAAHEHVYTKHKAGNVVLDLNQENG